MIGFFTHILRKCVSDKTDTYTFYRFKKKKIVFNQIGGLYIHIPFCNNMCPYCPYYKEKYSVHKASFFKQVLLKEIDLKLAMINQKHFTSLYFGGGSPLLMARELKEIINSLKKRITIDGPLGIEMHPNDIIDKNIKILKDLDFNLISLGVQSFQNHLLKKIGRNCSQHDIAQAIHKIKKQNFKTLNIDLMFVLDGQTEEDLQKDLETAVNLDVDQITTYPLFTFPYSTIGKFKKIHKLKLPNISKRRKMYYFISRFLMSKGYTRSSVWSFNKNKTIPYSSVTRDFYIGFGPSSATYNGSFFHFNTFSLNEYVKKLNKKELPIALEMKCSKKLQKLFWLYWRLYETYIPLKGYKKMFKKDFQSEFGWFLKIIKFLHLTSSQNNQCITLNTQGAHWIHVVQNFFALDYVNKIWSESSQNPWPEKIIL